MKYVYLITFDWSTEDAADVDITVYGNYDSAHEKFLELISEEKTPNLSWVGNVDFDENGYPIDDFYELEYEDNPDEEDAYWNFMVKGDYNRHSFISLTKKKIL